MSLRLWSAPLRAWLLVALLTALGCQDPLCPKGTERDGEPPPKGDGYRCYREEGPKRVYHGPEVGYFGTDPNRKRAEGAWQDGQKHGAWREWDEEGTLLLEEHYESGALHGLHKSFGPTGQPHREIHYKNGEEDGRIVRYHLMDGTKEEESEYRAGKRHGAYTRYARTGEVIEQGQYEDDAPSGTWIIFADGKKATERAYQGSRMTETTFDGEGRKRKELSHHEGRPQGAYKAWDEQGRLSEEGRYEQGEREGQWVVWLEPARGIGRYAEFKRGQRQGDWKVKDKEGQLLGARALAALGLEGEVVYSALDGKKAEEGLLRQGYREGKWTAWHGEARPAAERHYEHGRPTGTWRLWDGAGNLLVETEWRSTSDTERVRYQLHAANLLEHALVPQGELPAPLVAAVSDGYPVVVALADGSLLRLDSGELGKQKWKVSLPAPVLELGLQEPLARGGCRIRARLEDGTVLGIDTNDGKECFHAPEKATARPATVVVGQGKQRKAFVVVPVGKLVKAFAQEGAEPVWSFEAGAGVVGVAAGKQHVVILDAAGQLVSLAGADGKEVGRADLKGQGVGLEADDEDVFVVVKREAGYVVLTHTLARARDKRSPMAPSPGLPTLARRLDGDRDVVAIVTQDRVTRPSWGSSSPEPGIALEAAPVLSASIVGTSVYVLQGGERPSLSRVQLPAFSTPPGLLWRYPLPDGLACGEGLVFAREGAFAGCRGDKRLFKLASTRLRPEAAELRGELLGRSLWLSDQSFEGADWCQVEGGVLLVADRRHLWGIDAASGRARWKAAVDRWAEDDGAARHEPAVHDGVAWVGRGDELIAIAVDTGKELWRWAPSPAQDQDSCGEFSGVRAQPVAGPDGVFATARDGRLYAIDRASGAPRWDKCPGTFFDSPEDEAELEGEGEGEVPPRPRYEPLSWLPHEKAPRILGMNPVPHRYPTSGLLFWLADGSVLALRPADGSLQHSWHGGFGPELALDRFSFAVGAWPSVAWYFAPGGGNRSLQERWRTDVRGKLDAAAFGPLLVDGNDVHVAGYRKPPAGKRAGAEHRDHLVLDTHGKPRPPGHASLLDTRVALDRPLKRLCADGLLIFGVDEQAEQRVRAALAWGSKDAKP